MTAYVKVLLDGMIEYTIDGKKILIHPSNDGEGIIVSATRGLVIRPRADNSIEVRAT
jgi:hypothetical protein